MQQIGRYRILGEVGRGAMGIVYRAQDPAIGRVVAIKTIRLNDLADTSEREKLRERLMREAQSAGILSHPNIVTIYDVAEQEGVAYVAMEFVDGTTLDHLTADQAPDGKTIIGIIQQTASALDYAHKRGIVHRDIKPANIMVDSSGVAKITDFGVARIQSHQMTQAGLMVGTPNYMSPEQIQGQQVDGRSDQFSLAVIVYELLTGEKPFTADSIPSLAYKIVQEDPAPVQRLNQTLGWPVDTVLKRALSKDPAARYPSCSDFAVAVENACRGSRDWKPVTPGVLDASPTVTTAPVPQSEPRPIPPVIQPVSVSPAVVEELDEPPPTLLRWGRKLALAIVFAGVVGAGVIFGLRYLDPEVDGSPSSAKDMTAPPEPAKTEPAKTEPAKPSPTETAPAPSAEVTPPVTPPQEIPRLEMPRATPRASAAIRLVTNPPGATLEIDGSSGTTCTSPCTVDLAAGRHTMAATMSGFRRTLRIFESPKDQEIFINLERLSGTLVVRSEPRGALITVDGQPRSERTPAMLTLPIGKHTIQISSDNHSETREVTILDAVISNVAVSLEQ